MKKRLKDKFPFFLLLVMMLLFACNNKKHTSHLEGTKYTCPMHPQIIKAEPGSCPICGMDLVSISSKQSHGEINDSLASIIKPTNELVLSSIETIQPQIGIRSGKLNFRGIINFNTNNSNVISARVSGRIERLYVKYNYQAISKGQKLMDVYSPDLINAQQELLFLLDNNEPKLVEAAKKKLRLLGATEQQINQVMKTGKIDYSFSIYSPYSGYIFEKNKASVTSSSSSLNSTVISSTSNNNEKNAMSNASVMSSPTPTVSSNSALQIREGEYINAGQQLFTFINTSTVWAEFYSIPENLKNLKKDSKIEVNSIDNKTKTTHVTISLIQPYYNSGSNYSLIRAVVPNPHKVWKVGELINVSAEDMQQTGSWLPRTAIVQLGISFAVFVKHKAGFVPTYVTIKSISNDWINIGESLENDVKVARNAWFLVDTESFIKVNPLEN